jgi:Ras GTPase-activating-like protein IQGAP2/3
MHYIRPKQLVYVREALQSVICEVVSTDDLDLETDPSIVRTSVWPGLMISLILTFL